MLSTTSSRMPWRGARGASNAWPPGGRGLVRFSADWFSNPIGAQAENLYLTPSQAWRTLEVSRSRVPVHGALPSRPLPRYGVHGALLPWHAVHRALGSRLTSNNSRLCHGWWFVVLMIASALRSEPLSRAYSLVLWSSSLLGISSHECNCAFCHSVLHKTSSTSPFGRQADMGLPSARPSISVFVRSALYAFLGTTKFYSASTRPSPGALGRATQPKALEHATQPNCAPGQSHEGPGR